MFIAWAMGCSPSSVGVLLRALHANKGMKQEMPLLILKDLFSCFLRVLLRALHANKGMKQEMPLLILKDLFSCFLREFFYVLCTQIKE
jgi:hypothetical protein